jgi:hypothetical protein
VRGHEGNETGEYTYQGSIANRALELLGKHVGMWSNKLDHNLSLKIERIEHVIVDLKGTVISDEDSAPLPTNERGRG